MQKSMVSSVAHAEGSAGIAVSARVKAGLRQWDERDRAAIQRERLTNSNDRRFPCGGIVALSNPAFVYGSGSLVPQASDGSRPAR